MVLNHVAGVVCGRVGQECDCGLCSVCGKKPGSIHAGCIISGYVDFMFIFLRGVRSEGLAYVMVMGSGLVVCSTFLWFVLCFVM